MKEACATLEELNVIEELMAVHKKTADKGTVFSTSTEQIKAIFEKNSSLETKR
jgi:hypothetical protein